MNRKNYIINQDVKEKLKLIKIILIIMAVFILYCMIETGFPSDEVPDLFAEVKWNQGDKEDCISE